MFKYIILGSLGRDLVLLQACPTALEPGVHTVSHLIIAGEAHVPWLKLSVRSQPGSQGRPSDDVNIRANPASLLAVVNVSNCSVEATEASWNC